MVYQSLIGTSLAQCRKVFENAQSSQLRRIDCASYVKEVYDFLLSTCPESSYVEQCREIVRDFPEYFEGFPVDDDRHVVVAVDMSGVARDLCNICKHINSGGKYLPGYAVQFNTLTRILSYMGVPYQLNYTGPDNRRIDSVDLCGVVFPVPLDGPS